MNAISVNQPWVRSRQGWLAGVCQGIADRFDVHAGMIRLIWLGSVLFLGAGVLFYLICAFCLPLEGNEEQAKEGKILGVCARLSERMDIDVGLLRVLAVIIGFSSFGVTVLAYFIIHFLLPEGRQLKEVNSNSKTS